MTLHPQAQALLNAFSEQNLPSFEQMNQRKPALSRWASAIFRVSPKQSARCATSSFLGRPACCRCGCIIRHPARLGL